MQKRQIGWLTASLLILILVFSMTGMAFASNSGDNPNSPARGPEVELAAPGNNIYSTFKGGDYATISGTSMASPYVAGSAALVIASGVTDKSEVRSKLQSTADDLGSPGKDNLYGYGLVDAQEAATGVQTEL